MIDVLYAIVEPGADRIYYSHTPPTEYQKKPGAKVYEVNLYFPDLVASDGLITARAKEST